MMPYNLLTGDFGYRIDVLAVPLRANIILIVPYNLLTLHHSTNKQMKTGLITWNPLYLEHPFYSILPMTLFCATNTSSPSGTSTSACAAGEGGRGFIYHSLGWLQA